MDAQDPSTAGAVFCPAPYFQPTPNMVFKGEIKIDLNEDLFRTWMYHTCIIPGRYPGYPFGEEVEFKRGRDMPLPQGCGASMTARPSHPLRLFPSSHLPCVLAFLRVPPGMRSIHPHKWRGYLRARSARDSRSNIARFSAFALPSTSSSFFRLFPVCPLVSLTHPVSLSLSCVCHNLQA